MHRSHQKARQFEPGCDLRGTHHAAITRHRIDPLALPRVDPEAVRVDDTSEDAQLALLWLDAGYVDDSLADRPASQLTALAIERWMTRWTGEALNVGSLSVTFASHSHYYGREERENWAFNIDMDAPPSRVLQPRFEHIEAKAAGLFETAFSVLEAALSHVPWAGTPGGIQYVAEMYLWMGMSTDEDIREELIHCGMEPEDIEDRLLPSAYREGIPDWCLSPKRKLTKKQLKQLSKSPDDEVASIAKHTLALMSVVGKGSSFQVDDEFPLYPLVLLRWAESDAVLRCYDDVVHEANTNSDSFTSCVRNDAVSRIEPGEFNTWRSELEPTLTSIGIIDKLVGLLSIPDTTYIE